MCRLMAYFGDQTLVADVVLWPSRSIIKQSYDALERRDDSSLPFHLGRGSLNADGFGIGWYSPSSSSCSRQDRTPCTFKSVTPAWNNDNLNRLATKLESGLIFAHVRAAYPGMPVSEQNCHPFAHGNYLFMHNGVLAGFLDVRRSLLSELSDAAYNSVQSFHSDSAVCFSLFLHHLPSMTEEQPPEVLLQAIQSTIATISRIQLDAGVTDTSLLNFVVSDGKTLIATRYVSNDEQPASLYFAEGSAYKREQDTIDRTDGDKIKSEGDYHLVYGGNEARVCLVASEPVTASAAEWTEVPRNTALVVCQEKDGLLTVLTAPLVASGEHPRLGEVRECMQAVCDASNILSNASSHGGSCKDGHTTGSHAMGRTSGALQAGARAPPVLESAAARLAEGLAAQQQRHQHGHSEDGATQLAGNAFQTYHDHHHHSVQPLPPSTARGHPPNDGDLLPGTPRIEGFSIGSLKRQASAQSLLSMFSKDSIDSNISNQHQLTGHQGPVTALSAHGDLLFSGSTDSTVKAWSLEDCSCVRTLIGHRDPIRQLAVWISGTSDYLVSAGAKTVRFWDLYDDLSCAAVVQVSDISGSIKSLTINQYGMVYIGGQDCRVKAFSSEECISNKGCSAGDSPRCMKATETVRSCIGTAQSPFALSDSSSSHCGSVTCLTVCGDYVCSGSSDSTLRVWKADSLEFVRTLRGHRGSVLALHSVRGMLLSGGRDHLIRAWDVDTWVCRRTLAGHSNDILSITSISRDLSGNEMATTISSAMMPGRGYTRSFRVDLLTASSSYAFPSTDPTSQTGKLSSPPQEVYFASSSADGTVRIWSAASLTCIHILGNKSMAMPAVLSCVLTQEYAASGYVDGTVMLHPSDDVYTSPSPPQQQQQQASSSAESRNQISNGKGHETSVVKDPSLQGHSQEPGHRHAATEREERGERAVSAQQQVNQLEREFERALRLFIRIQTVSADPSKSQDCFRGAKFILRLLESIGAEVKLAQPVEGKNPVVLGKIRHDPSLATITVYGHYDVQPSLEPEWMTDPYEMSAVDGYYIGRGVSDNKGPILAFIYAVKELLQENGSLPTNVVFLFEGEEENGSIGFKEAVQQNLAWFEGTSAILISNTLWVGERRPCITYGMRGMIAMSVEVRGPSRDLHSGNEGGVFSEPLADLSKILASLVDSRNMICVPGFYDDVRPDMLTPAMKTMQTSEFSLEGYKKAIGVQMLTAGRSEEELLTARWCQPSLSVVDVRVGTTEDAEATGHYRFGPTRFSVIPRAAVGKISIRFVPNQDGWALIDRLRAHMKHEFAKLRSGNSISFKVHSIGDWWEANPNDWLVRMAQDAVEAEWQQTPLLVREGGTMPVASNLEKMLDAPALLLPMGQASDNCHLANERIRKINLLRGKNCIKNILTAVGAATRLEKK